MAAFTSKDARDANRSINGRYLLHRLAVAASLAPQIVSHIVVEIHPANPTVDFRFAEKFADHAILVNIKWHDSGRGCANASCYSTYPTGKMCDITTPPVTFLTGTKVPVTACQPACFIRQRIKRILNQATMYADRSLFVDDSEPTRCVECDLLNPLVTDHAIRRTVDNTYELWDLRSGKPTTTNPPGYHIASARETDDHSPQANADMSMLHWNQREHRCEIQSDSLLRTIAEPYWNDPTHHACRLTNFVVGETVVPHYYSADVKYGGNEAIRKANIDGFLMAHTPFYCRAFGKIQDAAGADCDTVWWEQALTYTILGEGVFRLVRNLTLPKSGCTADAFKPTDDDLQGFDVNPLLVRTYRHWRADVNTAFRLPPPNVSLLDLGIDVLLTGNRLYWNNFEGVLSHLAFFKSVEMVSAGTGGSSETASDWRDRYGNYNTDTPSDSSGMYGPLGTGSASVPIVPFAAAVLSEQMVDMLNALSSDSEGSSPFTDEDARRLVDAINELQDENRVLEIAKTFGIQIGADVARHYLGKAMKNALKRLVQYSMRSLGGRAAGAMVRVGLRVGVARVMGQIMSQLTTKLLLAGSAALTGVGIVVTVVELLSAAIDLAILFGWDPGNYKSYTSAASFRPMMDGYFGALVQQNALTVTPDVVVSLLLAATTDRSDSDKSSSEGKGTADARAQSGDATDTGVSFSGTADAIDLRVNVPHWFSNDWMNCFRTDDESLSTVTSALTGAAESVDRPRRDKLLMPRLPLENDDTLWLQFNVFMYLGALETNSYGQLVNLPAHETEFDDATIEQLVQEMDYRDVTTISSARNLDNRSYNQRVRLNQRLGGVLIGVGSVATLLIGIGTISERNRYSSAFSWLCVGLAFLALLAVAVSAWNFQVIDQPYLNTADTLQLTGARDDGWNRDPTKPDMPVAEQIDASIRERTISSLWKRVVRLVWP